MVVTDAVIFSEVSPEERLGNMVLYYNAVTGRLMVAADLDREGEPGKES